MSIYPRSRTSSLQAFPQSYRLQPLNWNKKEIMVQNVSIFKITYLNKVNLSCDTVPNIMV